jgi:hypothetical protein
MIPGVHFFIGIFAACPLLYQVEPAENPNRIPLIPMSIHLNPRVRF